MGNIVNSPSHKNPVQVILIAALKFRLFLRLRSPESEASFWRIVSGWYIGIVRSFS